MPVIQKALVRKFSVSFALFESLERIQHRNVVSLFDLEPSVLPRSFLSSPWRNLEDRSHAQQSHHRQNLAHALVLDRGQKHFREKGMKRQFRDSLTDLFCQLAFFVQSSLKFRKLDSAEAWLSSLCKNLTHSLYDYFMKDLSVSNSGFLHSR